MIQLVLNCNLLMRVFPLPHIRKSSRDSNAVPASLYGLPFIPDYVWGLGIRQKWAKSL
jgi:hypothetical protein